MHTECNSYRIAARRQRAEITVYTLRNGIVRAEDEEDNLYAAVDLGASKVGSRPLLLL